MTAPSFSVREHFGGDTLFQWNCTSVQESGSVLFLGDTVVKVLVLPKKTERQIPRRNTKTEVCRPVTMNSPSIGCTLALR